MDEHLLALAKLRLEEVLAFFEINATIKVTEEGNLILLNIDTTDSGRLIGRRGETLQAIQHLMNALVRHHSQDRVFVNVDVAGYKQGQIDLLSAHAKAAAAKALATSREQLLRPMNAAERRIVHMALAKIPTVVTESVGNDPNRRVVIKKRTD